MVPRNARNTRDDRDLYRDDRDVRDMYASILGMSGDL